MKMLSKVRIIYRIPVSSRTLFINNTLHSQENSLTKKTDGIDNLQEKQYNNILEDYDPNNVIYTKPDEDLNDIAPYLKPSFNFAAYINKSETLKQLVTIGVNLHKIEKNPEAVNLILSLNFENDVKKYISFFEELGLIQEEIAYILTRNPLILKEDPESLKIRINYLMCKKFNQEMILSIIQRNPFWLSYSTQDVDKMLGFFQKRFNLSGDDVRILTVKNPKLITYDQSKIKLNTFTLMEEMGFELTDVKQLLLDVPKLFMKDQRCVLKTFEYLVNEMSIEPKQIIQDPGILLCRFNRLRQRHRFLQKLGRDQFNPLKPNYVSLNSLVHATDSEFSTDIAKSSIQIFNMFLKSI